MLGQGTRLYWAIQWRRNEGLGALFLVLAVFAVIYAVLFPGILAVGAMAKFVQGWFPTAMVAAAETSRRSPYQNGWRSNRRSYY